VGGGEEGGGGELEQKKSDSAAQHGVLMDDRVGESVIQESKMQSECEGGEKRERYAPAHDPSSQRSHLP